MSGNNIDPDQIMQNVTSELGLHCLLMLVTQYLGLLQYCRVQVHGVRVSLCVTVSAIYKKWFVPLF